MSMFNACGCGYGYEAKRTRGEGDSTVWLSGASQAGGIMLASFRLKDFRSYEDATLPLAPLTVMIGANASGKSNAIEGLRFISWLAQGQKLSSIQHSINSGEQIVRGTMATLPREGCSEFGFSCFLSGRTWSDWNVTIELRPDGLHVKRESVTSPSETVPLYVLDQPSNDRGTDVGVAYNNFARGGMKPHITCTDQMAIFTQLVTPAAFGSEHRKSMKTIPAVAREFEQFLSSILFLDPNPHLMRGYSFPVDVRLRGDGSNLSAVIYNLCGKPAIKDGFSGLLTASSDGGAADGLLAFIQSLPEQVIDGIGFIQEPRGGVMVSLGETFGAVKRRFDASLLSDGTLRVLSIGAALLSAPEGSLVVIEEIDNGVHPSRARHLLAQIRALAESRRLRVLMTTHNPALLDALPDNSIGDVVFCYRSPDDGSSKMLRLEDHDEFPELMGQGTLGDLLTEGVIDRYAKLRRLPSERTEAARRWLASIR